MRGARIGSRSSLLLLQGDGTVSKRAERWRPEYCFEFGMSSGIICSKYC